MSTITMERINELNAERSQLYELAGRGEAGARGRRRITEISSELSKLWDERRCERAGRLDGIDLLIDQEYRRLYGAKYDEVVRPPAVAEAADGAPVLVAA